MLPTISIQFSFDLIEHQEAYYNRAFAAWVHGQDVPDTDSGEGELNVKFSEAELQERSGNFQQKVDLLWVVLDKFLEASSHTNLHCRVPLEKLPSSDRQQLSQIFLRPLRREKELSARSFIANFNDAPPTVLRALSENALLPVMDAVYGLLSQRDFATNQWLTLHLGLEESNGIGPDMLEVSVQLEILAA